MCIRDSLGDARTGTATYVEVFDRLGVSFERSREEGEIFLDFVDALSRRTNEAERLFDIREISGDGSPLFQAFADGNFIAAIQSAREQVNVLSDDSVKASRTIGAELADLRLAFRNDLYQSCLLYTSPSPRDRTRSRMPSSA